MVVTKRNKLLFTLKEKAIEFGNGEQRWHDEWWLKKR